MNKELLITIKLLALDDPEHFDMETFADDCGTTCCIAGFAVKIASPERFAELRGMRPPTPCLLSEWREYSDRWLSAGAQALGITKEQGDRLFFYEEWPDDLQTRYEEGRHPEVGDASLVASAVADRIDHFIATEGRE